MDARELAHTAKTWRDRLAGRVAFDLSAAEAAVRRAYRAGDLPEPTQVLWAKGPREAAQAIAFVKSPPCRLRVTALAVLLIGAATWVGLALATGGSALATQTPTAAGIWSAILAGLSLALAGGRRLPVPPDLSLRQYDGKLILVGVISFVALGGYTFALQRLGGLPSDPVGRGAALALAASVGTLPGVLLLWRIRRLYAPLPRCLRELAPSPSVARHLERARKGAWEPSPGGAIGPRPHASLLLAYDTAYREAFAPGEARPVHFGGSVMTDGSGQVRSGSLGETPPHLDGIEDAERAAATDCADVGDAAALFADLAFRVDRLYPFAAIAVAVQPATTIALDTEGRPHAEDGPALAWADGTRTHAWHGLLVPPELLDRDRPVTRSRIDREGDPERRWVLIERYGLGRYLLEAGAAEIQQDDCGRLYRLAQRLSEPILAVRVVNHTPEPDGSLREFWLRVPPTMATARQAVAWTFALPAHEYDPVAQS